MDGSHQRPVLILTAGMGAGHDGVATELARRLRERGVAVETVDMWDLLPLRLGRLIEAFYKTVILHLPWLYEFIYRFFLNPSKPKASRSSPVIRLATPRLSRWVAEHDPASAVSTFHLCSQLLGEMRRRALISFPVASVVVDFAAHNMWVHPDVDLHLCLHESQAKRIEDRGAQKAVAPGPIVGRPFLKTTWERRSARASLGLAETDRVILIVAGSWGAGRIVETVRTIASDGRFRALVVTGRNSRLCSEVAEIEGAVALGWVEDMDRVLAAADVVVGNAGGLTAMEAMATLTPVVSYLPIPGHGRENVVRMAEAGVSRYATSEVELLDFLESLTGACFEGADDVVVEAAIGAFRSDPVDYIVDMELGATPDS